MMICYGPHEGVVHGGRDGYRGGLTTARRQAATLVGMLRTLPPRPASPGLVPGAGARAPIPLLFLIADTGGGHRSAAQAVADALDLAQPGRFAPVLLDPLTGPRSAWPLRRVARLYGPLIRRAPWAWGVIYRASDSGRAVRLLGRTLLRLANRPVAEAATALRPAALVSFHPLAIPAAVAAAGPAPVVTVVTDLMTAHSAWRSGPVERIVTPSARVAWQCRLDGGGVDRCTDLGLPVGPGFRRGPSSRRDRGEQRRALGLGERSLVVVVTGGGEGAGGMARRVPALLEAFGDPGPRVEVVALCGRNRRLRRRLTRLVPAAGGRLTVLGFTDDMAAWLRCADVVVTKAGPGTIAEATCCGAPLILTSRLPGQEDGNAEFVAGAGAGRYAPDPADVVREVGRLRGSPAALDDMKAASARLGRPDAATSIATLIAGLAEAGASAGLTSAGLTSTGVTSAGLTSAGVTSAGSPATAPANTGRFYVRV